MTKIRNVVRVFLASPGDLRDERELAKATVDEFNDTVGRSLGYHVDLVGWEDTIGGYGRPQTLINKDLEQCEYFIGLMWQRWGSPPDSERGEFSSGFEEEFALTLRRRAQGTKPEISLFFKEIAPEFLRDPGEGLKQVLAFRKKIETEKTVFFETFSSEREYLKKLRRCIFSYIQGLATENAEQRSEQQQERPESSADAPSTQGQSDSLFSSSGMLFLRQFVDRAQRKHEELTRLDVARFRLLADIVQKPGNDEGVIGIHDANLLYLGISPSEFGPQELTGLADCGFRHFSTQSTPLWRWVSSIQSIGFTSASTSIGSNDQRQGALLAMSLTGEPLWVSNEVSREYYLNNWFSPQTHSSIKTAALTYLGVAGLAGDLKWIDQEIKRNDVQTRTAAEQAAIRINLRENRQKAIQSVLDLEPSAIDGELLQQLFADDSLFDEALLVSLLRHRNQNIRKAALQIAKRNSLLTIEIANRLLSDPSADIRLEALRYLMQTGRSFSESDAKGALVKPTVGALYPTDFEGDQVFERYQIDQFQGLSSEQLDEKVESSWIYFYVPYLARAEHHFGRYAETLRADIDDQFSKFFEGRLARMEIDLGKDSVKQARGLVEYLRKELCRKSLDILCSKMLAEDLALVRRALKSKFVDYSEKDAHYLAQFGQGSDIELLIAMTGRPVYRGAASMLFAGNDMYASVAKAILRLGIGRFGKVLNLEMPIGLKRALIIDCSHIAFAKLSIKLLCSLLRFGLTSVFRCPLLLYLLEQREPLFRSRNVGAQTS